MNETRIRKLLTDGEGVRVEFKTCRNALNRPTALPNVNFLYEFQNWNGTD